MELLDRYFALQKEIHDYFGYVEDWVAIPLEDNTEYHWQLFQREDGTGEVRFAASVEDLKDDGNGNFFESSIYTQRFLPKWVYRGEAFTMVVADTHTDGNKFLQIFDNSKEASR